MKVGSDWSLFSGEGSASRANRCEGGQNCEVRPHRSTPRTLSTERDTELVLHSQIDYHALSQALDLQRFKLVDESGVTLAMTRRFGRAPQNDGAFLATRRPPTARAAVRDARLCVWSS